MPAIPNGQKMPTDVIGAAVMVARIATGQLQDSTPNFNKARSGLAGMAGRINFLMPTQMTAIDKKAEAARGG
jgi:hypothetical protein